MPCQAVMTVDVAQFSPVVSVSWAAACKSTLQSLTRSESSGSGIATVLAHEVGVCAITGVGSLPIVNIKAMMASVVPRTMRAASVMPGLGSIPFNQAPPLVARFIGIPRIHVEHLCGGGGGKEDED